MEPLLLEIRRNTILNSDKYFNELGVRVKVDFWIGFYRKAQPGIVRSWVLEQGAAPHWRFDSGLIPSSSCLDTAPP